LSGIRQVAAALALALCASLPAASALRAAPAEQFPEPEALRPAVTFWVRVYTEATTDGGFLHDARLLDVVYEHVRFEGERNTRARERIVESHKRAIRALLDQLASGAAPRDERERQIVRLFSAALGRQPSARDFREAKSEVRFQLGQRDKFHTGLVQSGAYEAEMRAVFRDLGMPEDLAYLPHVESSFNVRAYSKYGAAGIWQFMRGTGRRFMKVDYVVDERLDPITATRAAARLLRENYALLESWPLALTAYNHGAGGMMRAVRKLGTRRIDEICERYQSRSFGFASRNFYAQFLAARKVLKSYESYFGPVRRAAPAPVEMVVLPFYADVDDLAQSLNLSPDRVAELNPALRPPVFRSSKRIPKGYALRVPAGTVVGDTSTWLAAVPKSLQHGEQHETRYYTVRRGDTLGKIAAKSHIRVADLVAENDLGARSRIHRGQVLQLPDRDAGRRPTLIRVAEAQKPAPPPLPAEPPSASAPPDTPPQPTSETSPAEAKEAEAVAAVPEPLSPVVTDPVTDSEVEAPDAPAPPPEAEIAESEAETVVEPHPEANNAAPPQEPLELALNEPAPQSESLAPQLPAARDSAPARAAMTGRVAVDDDETLGHFADWLEVSPQRLRNLNRLKPRRPIHVGQELKLDFSKVTPEEFQERRLEYHKGIEEDFFGSYRVTGTTEHVLRSGDTLWELSHKLYTVPTWLIHRYNPDVDFAKLTPGTKLVIPLVEKVG
jgi:membrane-bound lytic murein transglycosylase D